MIRTGSKGAEWILFLCKTAKGCFKERMKPHLLVSSSLNDIFSFNQPVFSLPKLTFPSLRTEVQCPELVVETQLRACSTLQSNENFVIQAVILISQVIRYPTVMVPFYCRLTLMHSQPLILSWTELPSEEGLCQFFPSLYLGWITAEYGFALFVIELCGFSLLKHIAVCLFLICYAYKSFKLCVKSCTVPKLPGCVLPELPGGPCFIHALNLATLSMVFSQSVVSILAGSPRPQDIKLLLFFSYT